MSIYLLSLTMQKYNFVFDFAIAVMIFSTECLFFLALIFVYSDPSGEVPDAYEKDFSALILAASVYKITDCDLTLLQKFGWLLCFKIISRIFLLLFSRMKRCCIMDADNSRKKHFLL